MAEIKEKPYIITIGTDNRPGGVEGEYHLQFKPDIMNVTFCEQEKVAKEFGGTMRVTDGQEWADFYHEADAVKFAEKVIHMNQERETAANKKKEGTKITVKGSHGKVLNLIPSDDPVKNRIVETLKDCLVFHDAKTVDDALEKTNDSYEMMVWNRLNKNLWEIAYRKNNTDIRLRISPSDDLSKIKVVEYERRYYGQSDIDESVGDFDLKDLSLVKGVMKKTDTHPEQNNDDISKVGFFKSGSGKNAGKYILYWEDDKGKNHRVYDLLDRKERYIISAFFKAVKEGRKEEFLNDLVSKLSKAQEKEVKKSDTNLKNQNMTSDSESVRVQLYDELSKKLGLIMPKHGDGVYLAMPLRAAEDSEKPMYIDRVYHNLGKKPGEFVCANMFYHVNMSDMSSVDLKKLIKVFDKKLHTNPNVTETKLNKATAAVKQAIHDRIVTPTSRRFISDQVESMKHYRSLFPVDTDTGKLFTHLHEDVCKQEDVACKPEKWKSDALRELNDLADGITRDQGRGLKR